VIMSSEKYELAQDELDSILERLESNISAILTSQGEARKRIVQVCSSLLDEGGKVLDEMEAEARTAPLQFRAEMLSNVRHHRSKLTGLQTKFHRTRVSSVRGDSGVKEGRNVAGGVDSVPDLYRQQVLTGSRALERTGESLMRAQQVAVETDAIGDEIIGDLGTQRETLERTRNRLIETDVELGRSRKILKKMYINVFSNKIVLIFIIIIELCILAGLLYWKFGLKH